MRASRSIWYQWAVGSSKVSPSRGIAFWGQDFEQVATVPASLLALGFDIHAGAAFLCMQVQCQTEHHRQVGVAPSSPASVGAGGWQNPSARPAPSPPTCWPSSASPPSSPASAAAASKPRSRLKDGRRLTRDTWPWWPCCRIVNFQGHQAGDFQGHPATLGAR